MAMGGNTDIRELALHIRNELAKLPWQGIPDGITERDETYALFDDSVTDLQNEVVLGTGSIFQGEIDILCIGTTLRHGRPGQFTHLVACLAQFHLSMQRRDTDEGLNGWLCGDLHGFPGSFDIDRVSSCNGTDLSILYPRCDQAYSLKLPR